MLHFPRVFDGDDGRIAPRKTFTLNLCRCFSITTFRFVLIRPRIHARFNSWRNVIFVWFFFLVRQVEIGTHALNFLIQSHTNTHSAK
ncbi:Uncharacterized protein APZ42_024705 [Daphnia magna]|uniref:Uncharacterized protein n=1 Tax=Daphnia magna TaxID=35525 RepID=A0A164TTQ4_9CRUS|nr:Uncharacterized protein APZ42_024705 [Daphnia magna]